MKIKVFLGIALLSVVSLSACASSRKVKTKSAPAQTVVSQEDEEIKKAERELNWRATRSIYDACKDSWRWQQNFSKNNK